MNKLVYGERIEIYKGWVLKFQNKVSKYYLLKYVKDSVIFVCTVYSEEVDKKEKLCNAESYEWITGIA